MKKDEAKAADHPKKKLTPAKLNILYFIHERGEYPGSISQLSRDMGYSSDSTVNTNLNELIRDGYVTEGPPYSVTKAGENELRFTRLPDYLVAIIAALGGIDIVVSLEDFAGLGPINPESTLAIGGALVIFAFVFYRVKRRIFREFLGLKDPLPRRDQVSDP
ncbi:MAG: MarR family transcriptional regulator [Nitrososphaerota archaeon]|jgi:hypothetical protein|nr:MarR family transcriptional regulator [Nitrososphaerota archaeon]